MFKLQIEKGESVVSEFALGEGVTTIGRSAKCDVRLTSPDVSRQHCRIHVKGDQAQVENLSQKGTRADGRSVDERVALADGSQLKLGGSTVLRVVFERGPLTPEAGASPGSSGEPSSPHAPKAITERGVADTRSLTATGEIEDDIFTSMPGRTIPDKVDAKPAGNNIELADDEAFVSMPGAGPDRSATDSAAKPGDAANDDGLFVSMPGAAAPPARIKPIPPTPTPGETDEDMFASMAPTAPKQPEAPVAPPPTPPEPPAPVAKEEHPPVVRAAPTRATLPPPSPSKLIPASRPKRKVAWIVVPGYRLVRGTLTALAICLVVAVLAVAIYAVRQLGRVRPGSGSESLAPLLLDDRADTAIDDSLLASLATWPPDVDRAMLQLKAHDQTSVGDRPQIRELIALTAELTSALEQYDRATTALIEWQLEQIPRFSPELSEPALWDRSPALRQARQTLDRKFRSLQKCANALYETDQTLGDIKGLPDEIEAWRHKDIVYAVLACDSTRMPWTGLSRTEPLGQYDAYVGIEDFFCQIAECTGKIVLRKFETPFPTELDRTLAFFEEVDALLLLVETEGEASWWQGKAGQKVDTYRRYRHWQDRFALLFTKYAEAFEGRRGLIAGTLALTFSSTPQSLVMSSGEPVKAWVAHRYETLKERHRRMHAEFQSAIDVDRSSARDEILSVGIPGDPLVDQVWNSGPWEAGTGDSP